MAFENYPKINYTFQNGKTFEVVDMFRKVSFSQKFLQNDSAFLESLISQGEKPEQIAKQIYNNPELSWLLFLANGVINPHIDWPMEYSSYLDLVKKTNNGDSYFITDLPILVPGDIAVKCDYNGQNWNFSHYIVIKKWNKEFRYFRGVGGTGTIASSDYVIFFRQNTTTKKFEQLGTYSLIRKKIEYYNSPINFYNSTSIVNLYNIVNESNQLTQYYASPISTSIAADPTYSNPDTIVNTVLYRYMTGFSYSSSVRTLLEQEIKKNNEKQTVNILKPEIAPLVLDIFRQALQTKFIGRSLQINIDI